MTLLGLTAPNAEWRAYNLREMAAVRDLAPKVLLVPLYDVKNAATLLKRSQLALLLDDLPGTRVLYRAMAGGIPALNPVTWAAECVTRYRFYADVARGGLIVANEPNLGVEWDDRLPSAGRVEDWPALVAWLVTCLSTVRGALPDVELHLPALSPVGGWQDGLRVFAASAELMRYVDVVDLHAYGADAHVLVTAGMAHFPGRIFSVTEFNGLKASALRAKLPPTVREATWFLVGGTPDQAAYDLIGSPYYDDFKETARQSMPTYSSPNHDGKRSQTLGVVLHSTRGGSSGPQSEYDATVAWFDNPASQVSAHAVVGPGGKVHLSVDPDNIAWHARSYNATHLGIEFAQAHRGDPIAGDILDAAAKIVAAWQQKYGFPLVLDVHHGLAQHKDIPPGIADGKTDIDHPFDAADFLARVQRIVTPAPALNVSELTTFPDWAKARLANNQDFRGGAGLTDFVAHLKGSGRDASNPARYGWPG